MVVKRRRGEERARGAAVERRRGERRRNEGRGREEVRADMGRRGQPRKGQ